MRIPTIMDSVMTGGMILPSPGFEKKLLSTRHMDLARRCAGQCTYCSTSATTPMRVHKARLALLAQEQLGVTADPTRDPGYAIAWDADAVLRRLAAQLRGKPRGWLAGETIMLSQLTDAFLGYPLQSGLTRSALEMVLSSGVLAPSQGNGRPAGRFRVLTKSDVVGRPEWIRFFAEHREHFVVGLSIGTIDSAWARRVEPATSKPSSRWTALLRLQDAGVATFGMLCPVFPDMVRNDGTPAVEELVSIMRPELLETVWAEPYNDRANWQAVQAGYEPGTPGSDWFQDVYGGEDRARGRMLWSRYATALYERLRCAAQKGGWLSKLKYLLYEDQIVQTDAPTFTGLEGVLLQSAPAEDGYSINPFIRALQRGPGHGRAASMR